MTRANHSSPAHRPDRLGGIRVVVLVVLSSATLFARESRSTPDSAATPERIFAQLVEAGRDGNELEIAASVAALAAFPHERVRIVLDAAAGPDRFDDDAQAGLIFLERRGSAADLDLLLGFARESLDPEVEAAALAVARRDHRALPVLADLLRTAPTFVRRAFVRAVESLETVDAAIWLAQCADRARDVRGEAIARLGRLAEKLPHSAPEEARALIHDALGGFESDGVREAVIAAGRMEDGDAIPYLLAMLGEPNQGLRQDAVWSLQRITGLNLRDRKERWEDWYSRELAWWRDDADTAFAELESSQDSARICALLEISSRHSSRDRLSLSVVPLLQDPNTEVAKLAANTLRVLRSKVACGALIDAMEGEEPGLAREAWRALQRITRKDLPQNAAEWRLICGP